MFNLPFDNPYTYPNHSGVDFPQPYGAKIKASGNGTVVASGWINSSAGYGVIVKYDNGISVLYCHMQKDSKLPANTMRVKRGSYLGGVGSTGNSTGPHLHMEIVIGRGAHTYQGIWYHFNRTALSAIDVKKLIEETEIGNMNIVRYKESYVLKPGKTGEYNATMSKRSVYYLFSDSWIKEISHKQAVSMKKVLGVKSKVTLATKTDVDTLKEILKAVN